TGAVDAGRFLRLLLRGVSGSGSRHGVVSTWRGAGWRGPGLGHVITWPKQASVKANSAAPAIFCPWRYASSRVRLGVETRRQWADRHSCAQRRLTWPSISCSPTPASPRVRPEGPWQGRKRMPARTGEQFLNGLRGQREIWVDGERITDVVSHPKLRGAAHALAEIYDLQHVERAACLMADPESGEAISGSHMIPRLREDLRRRGKALRIVAEYSVGLMGRTPDYMNVTYAGFAGRPDEWGAHGNEAGAERLIAYQKFLRRGDISLTHTIVQPTVDK